MPPQKKKVVKKKKRDDDGKEEPGPEPEHRVFFGNHYFGVVHTDPLGVQCLEGNGTYSWPGEDITYVGPMRKSVISGDGQLTWIDGSEYNGGLVLGQRDGHGTLKRKDGVTYKGNWKQGQRNGEGRLTYAVGLNVNYDGQWLEGKKHGFGTQVWPSGNVYEGNWDQGEMAGYGEMCWQHGDTYKGTWKAGVPDGEGEYCWASTSERNEEQQAYNRYIGAWKDGKRHGFGVFIYADGSRYQGQWLEGKKHGQGKVTFVDGNVYEGPFKEDWVEGAVERLSMPIVPKAVLDLGGVDNPIRQMMQIHDLDAVEMPTLLIPDEEQRETHNILLRNLGQIKQVYFRYRRLLKRNTEDPYCMSTLQLWLFCRDHGLVTSRCSYAAINRAVAYGTRYTQEHCASLLQDVRVLAGRKPKEVPQSRRRKSKEGRGSALVGDSDKRHRETNARLSGVQEHGEDTRRKADHGEHGTEHQGKRKTEHGEEHQSKRKTHVDAEHHGKRRTHAADEPFKEDPVPEEPGPAKDTGHNMYHADLDPIVPVDDVHSDSHQLLLRHFFEIIVRIAIVRFPEFKYIHEKVDELVTNRMIPRLKIDGASTLSESEWIFEHAEEAPKSANYTNLEALFIKFGKTRGAFGPDDKTNNVVEFINSLELTPEGGAEVELSRRQAHVCGRRDATLPVRNLFKMLKKLGFLHRKIAAEHLSGMQVFPVTEDDITSFNDIGMTKESMLDVQRMTLAPTSGIEGLLGGFKTQGSMLEGFGEAAPESALAMLSNDRMLQAGRLDGTVEDSEEPLSPKDAIQLIDFSLSVQEALSIVTDGFSVDNLQAITVAPHDGNSLLELLDYELTQSEFIRFFYVVSQRRIKGGAGSGGGSQFQVQRPGTADSKPSESLEKLDPPEVFDLYLDNIFFPAFHNAYPQQEDEEEGDKKEEEGEEEREGEADEGETAERDAEKLSQEANKEELEAEKEEEQDDAWSAFSTSKASKTSKQTPEAPPERNYPRELWSGFAAPRGSAAPARRMPSHLVAGLTAPVHRGTHHGSMRDVAAM